MIRRPPRSTLFPYTTLSRSFILPATAPAADAPKAKPNILWLIAEDFGNHLSCCGTKEVWTPNLDRLAAEGDRKSTRLNSSHSQISYAVFCLKKTTYIQPPVR